ncbi:MAG: hypothetical protein Q7S29_06505 [Candidatus Peribacter sp.]|nr:hypothetical protein [Candidatus Peribacter sp.]
MNDSRSEHTMSQVARLAVVKDSTRQAIQEARTMLSGQVADILTQYTDGSGADDVVSAVSDVYREGTLRNRSDTTSQRNPVEIVEGLQDIIVSLVRRIQELQIAVGKPESAKTPV